MPKLSQNDGDQAGFRHEIKATAGELELPRIRALVRSHPAAFRVAFPPRRVNNLYLDSVNWGNLADNLAGSCRRAKLRLRWYGDTLRVRSGILEIKSKIDALGTKLACRLATEIDIETMTWREILSLIRDEAHGSVARQLRRTDRPALLNHYHREYYVSSDGHVRLTLDSRITSYTQLFGPRPNTRRAMIEPVVVVEIKAAAGSRDVLADVLGTLPMRTGAHSKYAVGMLGRMEAGTAPRFPYRPIASKPPCPDPIELDLPPLVYPPKHRRRATPQPIPEPATR